MKILICSVGGSPQPIITSIDELCPDKIIYIASPESRRKIRHDIESNLYWNQILDIETVTLSNYQDLLTSIRDIRNGLDKAFKHMDVKENDEIYADITGGTKVMSSALTLVASEFPCRLRYIGGDVRTKDGLGIVVDGEEKICRADNPWEVMAAKKVQHLAELFNAGVYPAALDAASELCLKLPERKPFFEIFKTLVEAYSLWDAFSHKDAATRLKSVPHRLLPYASVSGAVEGIRQAIDRDREILNRICEDAESLRGNDKKLPKGCGLAYLNDLVANAKRCAMRGRYDDAVARLYSAIEKKAKITLLAEHGIDNSSVDLSSVPEAFRGEIQKDADTDGTVKIGLDKTYQLLSALDDPLGKQYELHAEMLHNTLLSRNQSLLAHGFTPVSQKDYDKLFALALSFLGVKENELPVFARLDWKALV